MGSFLVWETKTSINDCKTCKKPYILKILQEFLQKNQCNISLRKLNIFILFSWLTWETTKAHKLHLKADHSNHLSNNKGLHTTRLCWQCPFNVVGCKDRLLDAAAFHQIIGKHSWTQAVLGVAVHKHQLRQWMRGERKQSYSGVYKV